MRVLNITTSDMFKPLEGKYELTFVPSSMGANYLIYQMHWLDNKITVGGFPCLGKRCPICFLAKRSTGEEALKLRPKNRVLINVWEGDSLVKVWDSSLWLLSKGMGGEYNPAVLGDSRLWDPSKYGLSLSLVVKRERRFPEYIITKSIRRFEIPDAVLNQARNLKALIYVPSMEEVEEALDDVLLYDKKIQIQRTESVGETAKITFDEIDKIYKEYGIDKKSGIELKPKKKQEYQEPEPYKRVRRIIIMDEED